MPSKQADRIGWAEHAAQTRDCLDHLGFSIAEDCMPDEPHPCGGTYQQHAQANLTALMAVIHHHLVHAGGILPEAYEWAVGKIAQECPRE